MFGSIRVLNSIDIIIYLYQILSRHDDFKNHTGDWQALTLRDKYIEELGRPSSLSLNHFINVFFKAVMGVIFYILCT